MHIFFFFTDRNARCQCYRYSDGDAGSCRIHGPAHSLISDEVSVTEMTTDCSKSSILLRSPGFLHSSCPPAMHKSCFCIRFIAEHTKITDDATKVTACHLRRSEPDVNGSPTDVVTPESPAVSGFPAHIMFGKNPGFFFFYYYLPTYEPKMSSYSVAGFSF